MIWEALIRIAIIGTERGTLPEPAQEALSRLGVDTEADPARAVLEGAALYHQLRRAGFPIGTFEGELPLQAEAAPEGKSPVSGRSARHLKLILEGRFRKALPEYLQLLKTHQKSIPPEHLSALFYFSLKSDALWRILQESLSPFCRWLLRQNPDWEALAGREDVESWPDAMHKEQLSMLRYIRRTQPAEAISLLKNSWDEYSFSEKQAFLKEMETGLGRYDEPFLEHCLSDSRKGVRTAAALLLAHLPDSALSGRLFSRARALFREEKKGLAFHFPEKLDDELKRDGIGAASKKHPEGQRAGWAFEMISRIPPRRWEEHFSRPTVDTLRLVAGTNRKKLLLEGLANAAILHQDHRWIEALLRYWWRTDDEEGWSGNTGKLLMGNLPDPVFNEIALQHLRQNPGFIEEKSFISQMLGLGAHNWNDALAQLVLQGFQQWLSGARSYFWNLWHYKRILEVAAYRINPGLLENFRTGWDARSPVWYRWEKDVERFLKVLAFRRDMRGEMK
ncbi:MAG: hypothetical protein KDD06_07140 [Phaeodactylibacter sp.]|nr:hypothetical protein [Phaeodactylibacter sp.]MCB9288209.1 hypothetical protein [Lewinellaceae bacterium]